MTAPGPAPTPTKKPSAEAAEFYKQRMAGLVFGAPYAALLRALVLKTAYPWYAPPSWPPMTAKLALGIVLLFAAVAVASKSDSQVKFDLVWFFFAITFSALFMLLLAYVFSFIF